MEPMVPVNKIITSATAKILDTAKSVLTGPISWPNPATGFAYRLCGQTGTVKPDFMNVPLRDTTSAHLRLTPELAAFGYTMKEANERTHQMWFEGLERLRGREIYPADRQSFIFNPTEILGVAVGLTTCQMATDDQREWFANTIVRGLRTGQFRTPLSKASALTALTYVDQKKGAAMDQAPVDMETLSTPELVIAAGVDMAFTQSSLLSRDAIEQELVSRLLKGQIAVNDAAEASTVFILFNRVIDRIALVGGETTPVDMVMGLCRRFPLFVERLRNRQRNRDPVAIEDEYDVQDLLHGILKLHFDDVRPEEYTPSYGGNASKVDFLLPRERIVVETKMTRRGLDQREVTDELIIDTARYSKMDGVDTLICLVYDPDRRCRNPKTVESDVENSGSRLTVRAVVCPQGF
jgi:hypothetical protein